jgi:putative ABC transport system permease protein
MVNLVHTDLGYSTERVLRARVALPDRLYPDAASFLRFHDRLAERLAAVPGTEFAVTNHIPFYPTPQQKVEIDTGENPGLAVGVLAVSEGYFSTLRIGLKEGRGFVAADRPGGEPVAIVSESLARRLWPQGSALGRRLRTADQPVANAPLTAWRTVVGVARDVRQTYVDTDLNDILVPFAQAPSRYAPLFLRTDRPATYWAQALRTATAELDPDVQITGFNPLAAEGEKLLARPRFLTAVLMVAAAFAALLAFLGVYGVTAYSVQQREREIAIRMALGATSAAVVQKIISGGAAVLVTGLAFGLFAAIAAARLLASHIHGVPLRDVPTLLVTGSFVAAAGVLATWWPARRAVGIDPLTILKSE